MHYLRSNKPELLERAMAAASYLSGGLIGLIYILLSGKYSNTSFFRFHFLQSIVISIFIYLIGWAGTVFKDILNGILGLVTSLFIQLQGLALPFNVGVDWTLFLVNKGALLLLLYGFIFALIGRYAEIPVLSKLIYRQIR